VSIEIGLRSALSVTQRDAKAKNSRALERAVLPPGARLQSAWLEHIEAVRRERASHTLWQFSS
jgi:hypothetical protein